MHPWPAIDTGIFSAFSAPKIDGALNYKFITN